ncbi:RagB/SusD family nutrient uptake outer membrane protein [Fulvivirga sp. M361]|uniref:RagB/SusD family nutrient uptake outer membrane protein n=1 Tax=Fulvivirga sp. M361 TaxID=2594266 RepID=UPI00117A9676|nr:RagB/SusD family nutrient uptake outer membrane protein [Fulvivirga sp. M361]TRX61828.1 RagB/SusD family nutrient uptake outer membrane protein [Fulvivirga sp. M361]
MKQTKIKSTALIYIFVINIALSGLIGCDDFLEETNRTSITDANGLSDPDTYDQFVAEAYNQLREALVNFGLDHQGTDIATREDLITGVSELNDYVNINPSNGTVTDYWKAYYEVILAANNVELVSGQVQGLSDAARDLGLAEALFIRAYAYFHLVENYGDVPLVVEEVDLNALNFVKSPEEQVYDQMVADLQQAIAGLPETVTVFGRATKDAAKHLLAKVLLTRGYKSYANSNDFEEAARLAEEVIANHPLEDSYAELVSIDNQRNSEVIFSVLYGPDALSRGPGGVRHTFFKFSYDVYPGLNRSNTYGRGNGQMVTPFFISLFEDDDEREAATLRRVVYAVEDFAETDDGPVVIAVGDTAIYFPKVPWSQAEIDSKVYAVINPDTYFEINFGNGVAAPMFLKFDDPTVPYANPGIAPGGIRDAILMRAGETRLIAAEAYLNAGNAGTAADHLNAIRTRAGASVIQANDVDLDLILDESARELAGEVSRWMELKRTGKLMERVLAHNPHAALNNSIETCHVVRPIPQNDIDATNRSLIQNSCYQ